MLTGRISAFEFPEVLHKATKLTVYVGRHERANGRPAYEAVVGLLRERGESPGRRCSSAWTEPPTVPAGAPPSSAVTPTCR